MTDLATEPPQVDPPPGTPGTPGDGPKPPAPKRKRRFRGTATSFYAAGEPARWLAGGGLALCLVMIVALVLLVLYQGGSTFWPSPLERFETRTGGAVQGEVTRDETFVPGPEVLDALGPEELAAAEAQLASEGGVRRRLVRTGNFDLTGEHFRWIPDYELGPEGRTEPAWGVVIERLTWGRFYGTPAAFLLDGEVIAEGPEASWELFLEHHGDSRDRWEQRRDLEIHDIGAVNRDLEAARLELRGVELDQGSTSAAYAEALAAAAVVEAEGERDFTRLSEEIAALNAENARYVLRLDTAEGFTKELELSEIVRAYPANSLNLGDKLSIYLSRWGEFLTDDPREANAEGGVFPAIWGTLAMTMLMSLLVVPFGVLAALYLREYAKDGPVVAAVRIAVNNLAGVPSIVFGVFGLGFFCYIVGGSIDEVFFPERLPSPTFGTGGLLWASLTLALLTLPVVIVAAEEALAAVPSSMREGSYACGASKWQTIQRIVIPRAMPGIMTGMILAMARGAGEVAPLMLVGAVKLAPELPVDGVFPFLHAQRSFMHLGFHIYDLGFQSQNSEAAKPMVFTTTLLLIAIITGLNVFAVWLRTRLRRRFVASQF